MRLLRTVARLTLNPWSLMVADGIAYATHHPTVGLLGTVAFFLSVWLFPSWDGGMVDW